MTLAAEGGSRSLVRQPVHTVYGGAHLFRADSARKLGAVALRFLREYGGNGALLARAVGLPGSGSLPDVPAALEAEYATDPEALKTRYPEAWLAFTVFDRVRTKIETEPVEDFRIDFEDGYGYRPDGEEDACAADAAGEVARGMAEGTLPPFVGIRIKPVTSGWARRALRTLGLFLRTVTERTRGVLPAGFVVTLPKVTAPDQVRALTDAFERLEGELGLGAGALRLEIMVETPQALLGPDGRCPLPDFVAAAGGRCVAAHFGVYDYTASLGIAAAHQRLRHPACDLARQMMQLALADTGVWLSDGATNVLPVPVHRAEDPGATLAPRQIEENRRAVHRAWRLHFEDVRHSLAGAFYQGWDLHPAQLPTRYAAVYAFFLENLDAASARLRTFVERAARATLVGDVFDDAATGRGLLTFFLRGLACGAITEREASATGLTPEELRSPSFAAIVEKRRGGGSAVADAPAGAIRPSVSPGEPDSHT